MLKKASRMLIYTIYEEISTKDEPKAKVSAKRIKVPNIRAIARLTAGPTAATFASPHFWSRRLYGLYGTGLAQPKRIPALVRKRIPGTRIEPIGSI